MEQECISPGAHSLCATLGKLNGPHVPPDEWIGNPEQGTKYLEIFGKAVVSQPFQEVSRINLITILLTI